MIKVKHYSTESTEVQKKKTDCFFYLFVFY